MYFNYKGQSIFAFSDTHGMHRGLRIPSNIEILICAGDVITDFSEEGLKDFLNWYSNVPARCVYLFLETMRFCLIIIQTNSTSCFLTILCACTIGEWNTKEYLSIL